MTWFLTVALLVFVGGCTGGAGESDGIGACCDDTDCSLVVESNCGGVFVGGLCAPNPCFDVGACCFVGGDCSLLNEFDCNAAFQGAGTDCSMCPTSAACCDEDNVCTEVAAAEDCDGRATVGAECSPGFCDPPQPPPTMACCNGTQCSVRTPDECEMQGGTSLPSEASCDPNPCERPGACCLADGRCIEVDSPDCDGVYVGNPTAGPACAPNTCNGACCGFTNQCSIGALAECIGDFVGPRTRCEPDPCENQVGACCEERGCREQFRTECDTLFFSNLTCDPDPCPQEITAEVAVLCAGVSVDGGASSLAWSFAVASNVSLSGAALELGVEGPGAPFTAEGVVDDDGRVRIEDVEAEALGTYTYQVVSIGNASISGDLDGSIVVDGTEQPCPPGGGSGSPFSECFERPPGSLACDCDPLNDNCSGNLNCSLNLEVQLDDNRVVTGVPALDGSEDSPATECISDFIQTIGAGGACEIVGGGEVRRDECLPGLVCDPESNDICVPLCVNDSDCVDNSCELYAIDEPEIGRLGRCTVP